jgi:hypothetical protein
MRLIAGQKNVLYFKVKVGYAKGTSKPKRIKKVIEIQFNAPILCIKLRKAA